HRESRSPHGRDAHLRRRSHFDDPGSRQFLDGNASLRHGPAATPGEDNREGKSRAGRSQGRRGIGKEWLGGETGALASLPRAKSKGPLRTAARTPKNRFTSTTF